MRIAAMAVLWAVVAARAATLESRAAKIMVRAIDVEEVSPKEVFEFLREQSKAADPEGKGINMLFRFGPAGLKAFTEGTVTLKMNNVPLSELVRYVCIASGLLYNYDAYTLMVYDASTPQSMETKIYRLNAGVLEGKRTRDKPDGMEGGFSTGGNHNNRN